VLGSGEELEKFVVGHSQESVQLGYFFVTINFVNGEVVTRGRESIGKAVMSLARWTREER
jgi:hypothetical protein